MDKHGAVSGKIVDPLCASHNNPLQLVLKYVDPVKVLWRSARCSFAFSCRITAKMKKFKITFKIYFSKVLVSSLHSCIFHSPPPSVFSCRNRFPFYVFQISFAEDKTDTTEILDELKISLFTLWIRHRRPWQNRTKKPASADEIQSLQPYRKLPILLSSQTKAKNVNVEPSWNKRRYRQTAKRTPEVHPRYKR